MTTAFSDERRQHSRIVFHTPAHLVFCGDQVEVQILDISFKGALIQTTSSEPTRAFIVGEACRLDIPLDNLDDQISMETLVTHSQGNRAGLLCQIIDLDSITHLRRLVELNLGDTSLLERELSALIAE